MTVEELIKALEQMPCQSTASVVMADYIPVERVVWDSTYGSGVVIITDREEEEEEDEEISR